MSQRHEPPRSALSALLVLLVLSVGSATTSGQTGRLELQLNSDPALVAAEFLAPAIRIEVNGETAWMLVDTGAAVHAWSRWFVEAARLATVPAPAQADVRDSTATRLDHGWAAPVSLRSDGALVRLGVAAIAEFPAEFRAARVAGVLSPQLLAGAGEAVVLNMQRQHLSVESEATAFAGEPSLVEGRDAFTCSREAGGLRALSYGVVASAGSKRLRLLLDTGANHTKVAASSAPALASAPGESGTATGLSGRREGVRLVSADVEFVGRTRRIEVRVSASRESGCGPDGLLGMDALAGCVLVLGRQRLAARCGT